MSAGIATALWVILKWRSWREQGWPGLRSGAMGFAWGLGIGALMAAIVLVAEVALGGVRVQMTGQPFSAYAAVAPVLFFWLAVAALAEELLFRGFPLARLAQVTGPVAATFILTVGFTGVHAMNPGVTPLGLFNVGLASLVLSAAFFAWGGLPAAWGLHLGWNAGLVLGAAAPVSGLSIELPGLHYLRAGPDWLSGGDFGPEGGLLASFVMLAAIMVLGNRVISGRGAAAVLERSSVEPAA
ncbi:MAG: CPBP family intramembrane metalloprotease [Gemmatimonadetes bacterium]|nr:CPBP family intramembrane metalloprotease [Gemmatimonadota bacterium]